MTRRHPLLLVSLAVLVVLEASTLAQEAAPPADVAAKTNVLVFNLEATKTLQGLAKQLTDEILLTLGKEAGLNVVGESEIALMLKHEKDKELLTCTNDTSCLARISGSLQAEKSIVGSVGQLGETFVVTLKLTDTKKVSVEAGESVSSEEERDLVELVGKAARRLLGLEAGGEQAKFKLQIAAEGTKVAVMELAGQDLKAGAAANLTDLLCLELKKFEGLNVVSRSEIETMLQYQVDKMVLQCKSDTSCLVEIGGALGVDYLVSGGLGRLGKAFVVNLKLLDINRAQPVNRVSETFEGDETELPRALRFATLRLLGWVPEGAGAVKLASNVDKGGSIVIDGAKPQPFPLKTPLGEMAVGKHGFDLSAKGYFNSYREGYVEPGKTTQLRIDLKERPKPWFKRWYTWTIIGVVLTGGAAVIIWAATKEPDSGTVTVTFQ
jgi:TolB-like protein